MQEERTCSWLRSAKEENRAGSHSSTSFKKLLVRIPDQPPGPAPVASVSRKGSPDAVIAALNSLSSSAKLALSLGEPPLSDRPGYSQSISYLQSCAMSHKSHAMSHKSCAMSAP